MTAFIPPDLQTPATGSVPFATGVASVARIPIPGSNGLCLELRPRGPIPPAGSTSTVFFQDLTGHRQLRLDYHLIHETQTIDYHWNQQRTYATFGVSNHQPASLAAEHLYRFAKYFKWMGRTFLILGVALVAETNVRSTTPLRRAA